MQFDKQQVIDLLKSRGDHDQASQAQSNLPDKVDSDQHADQLSKLGVNPSELIKSAKDKLGF